MVLWQLYKVSERILIQDEGKLIAFYVPVGYCWHNAQEALEANLQGVNSCISNFSIFLGCKHTYKLVGFMTILSHHISTDEDNQGLRFDKALLIEVTVQKVMLTKLDFLLMLLGIKSSSPSLGRPIGT